MMILGIHHHNWEIESAMGERRSKKLDPGDNNQSAMDSIYSR